MTKRKMMVRGAILLLGIIAMTPAFSQALPDTLPDSPAHYKLRLDRFNKEKVVVGKVMFLGSSNVEGGNWRRLLKDSTIINRGIAGDNTFSILQRIDEVTKRKPSKIFLLVGANDISRNTPTAFLIENIFSIVGKIHNASPKTQIFVQSLLPVNPKFKDFPAGYSKQETIVEVNGQLKKYSETLNYTFVDIHSPFLDNQKMLDSRYTKDGVLLNTAGYVHWVDVLKKNKFL